MSLQERIFQVSLLNLTTGVRLALHRDELGIAILHQRRLFRWMLACSNTDEQYFLSSCDSAASNVSLMSHHTTIASLLVVSRLIGKAFEAQMAGLSEKTRAYATIWPQWTAPSQKQYVTQRRLFFLKENERIYRLGLEYARDEKGNGPSLDKLFHLTKMWNFSMQSFSSVFFASQPVVMTRKLIPDRWHLSTFLMTLLCALSSLLPTQPSLNARKEAPHDMSYLHGYNYHTFRTTVQRNYVYCNFATILRGFANEMDSEKQQIQFVKKLWKKALKMGGLLFASKEHVYGRWWVGHQSFLVSVVFNTESPDRSLKKVKFFLIADPEIRRYKIVNFEQMRNLVKDRKVVFDLIDVIGVEQRRVY